MEVGEEEDNEDGSMEVVGAVAYDHHVGEVVDTCKEKRLHEQFLAFLGRDVVEEDKEMLCQANVEKGGQEPGEVEGDARTRRVAPRLQHHVLMLLADTDPAATPVEPPAFGQAWFPLKS